MNDHTIFFQIAGQRRRDIFILERQDAIFFINQENFGASVIRENRREFTADHTCTQDHNTFREIRQ